MGRGQNQKLQESSLVKPDSIFHTFFTPMQFNVQENEFLQLYLRYIITVCEDGAQHIKYAIKNILMYIFFYIIPQRRFTLYLRYIITVCEDGAQHIKYAIKNILMYIFSIYIYIYMCVNKSRISRG